MLGKPFHYLRGIIEWQIDIYQATRVSRWGAEDGIGADQKSALITLIDRATLFTLSENIPRKTARNVSRAMIRMLRPYREKVHTPTFDNGTEFTEHERVGKALEASTYFAAPYASWERGINENTNGLLRQFIPTPRVLVSYPLILKT